ncbi:MAG: hypothetical protein ACR2OD_07745, partial [Gaiellaceae bacterium]
MSGQVWVPGSAGAPAPPSATDFLKSIHAQIQAFAEHCQCERAVVEVLLHDGRRLRLRSMSAEPGFGWVTLQPVPEDADSDTDGEADPDAPVEESLMLPLQSIVRIVMRRPDGEE